MTLNYFAFGSNLASRRLRQRIPQASVHCVAILKQQNDRGQSGKCDIDFTGDPEHLVYGVIYRMTRSEKEQLDIVEGAGFGYDHKTIEVIALHGEVIEAFTYYALDIDHDQQPFHWYKEHVLRGALEHDFPPHYVEHIRSTASIDDHDPERHHRELSIYLDAP
jgi:hypothetical protein